jgi:transposase
VSLLGRPSKYTDEFKRDAVDLVRSSGRPINHVAWELGLCHETLRNWVRAADPQRRKPPADSGEAGASLNVAEKDAEITAGISAVIGGVNFGKGFATTSISARVELKLAEWLFDKAGGAFIVVQRLAIDGDAFRILPAFVRRSEGFKSIIKAVDTIAAGANSVLNGLTGMIQSLHDEQDG